MNTDKFIYNSESHRISFKSFINPYDIEITHDNFLEINNILLKNGILHSLILNIDGILCKVELWSIEEISGLAFFEYQKIEMIYEHIIKQNFEFDAFNIIEVGLGGYQFRKFINMIGYHDGWVQLSYITFV